MHYDDFYTKMTTSFNTIVTKYGPTYYIVQPNPKTRILLYCPHDDPMMIMMTDIWTLYEDKKHHILYKAAVNIRNFAAQIRSR